MRRVRCGFKMTQGILMIHPYGPRPKNILDDAVSVWHLRVVDEPIASLLAMHCSFGQSCRW